MAWLDTISEEIETYLSTTWEERNGSVIPDPDSVTKDQSVKIKAAFLYADLAGSSKLARLCPWSTTVKIIRTFLHFSTRTIRRHRGEIRSFDGDRVMGVFMGAAPNTDAVNCAREIFYLVEKVLRPMATLKFNSVKNNNIKITNCIGIDYGEAYAVMAGIRSNHDLIWIGTPPSLAALLTDIIILVFLAVL